MRLIDADALIKVLKREEKEHDEYGLTQRADGITDAIMDVIDAPTIEPQKMKGRWETDAYGAMDDGEYLVTRCNVCGTAYEYGHNDRYCGFCGAAMEAQNETS